MSRGSRIAVLITGVLVLTTSACASNQNPTVSESSPASSPASGAAVTGEVTAVDQTSDGSSITVGSVEISGKDGFIAVHRDDDGKPGAVVGHSAVLAEGKTERDVVVKLDEKVASGAYWAMLHEDSDGNGKYEFPPNDPPVVVGGKIVMEKLTLTVS